MSDSFGAFGKFFGQGTLYLGFLHFESEDLPKAFCLVREACEAGDTAVCDLKDFLGRSGWREHLTVCAVMLSNRKLASILAPSLWVAFDAGSWVSPQLAVTALLCDPCFQAKARARVASLCAQNAQSLESLPPLERHVVAGPGALSDRAAKGVASLIYLLELSPSNAEWLGDQLARRELKELIELDVDRGGFIAEHWLARIRARSTELGLQVS